ncbi:MAG TPA: alkaline phosphatase [Rhodobiaceae bacterium]|nr:alkaline phosphatase [Rhodobiaceae bacterium]
MPGKKSISKLPLICGFQSPTDKSCSLLVSEQTGCLSVMHTLFTKPRILASSICLVWGSFFSSIVSAETESTTPQETTTIASEATSAKNVILIIGDGMDDHQITIARNYLAGVNGRLSLDTMARRSIAQVLTVSNMEPDLPVYVADSANSATSIATGTVTSRGRISTTAGSDEDLRTIVEMASEAGIKTGLVSTASVTDATVAAFYAHISLRVCENPSMMRDALLFDRIPIDCSPDMKENGGLGSISEQLVSSNLNLALGGGTKHFSPIMEGKDVSVATAAEAAGFQVLRTIEDLNSASLETRWLGLFAPSTMPIRLQGEGGRSAESPLPSFMNRVHWSQGDVTLPEPTTCEENPEFAGTPSLKLMTDRALDQLSHNNTNGFFLMIESASIDKQSHLRNACGSIGEVAQLEEALQSALGFANKNPETLIIVTADHGQAAQLVPTESLFDAFGLPVYTPGQVMRIRTPEGALMTVNYATNSFLSEEHTGVSVPVLTNSTGPFPTMLTQPDLFDIMTDHLGLAD